MRETLQPGLTGEFEFVVPITKTVPHLYPEAPEFQAMPDVFATGFMVGLIDASNWSFWREILLAAASLSESELLITVYSQKEANLIAKEMERAGWGGEVIDNQDSGGIYDQWVYRGRREAL